MEAILKNFRYGEADHAEVIKVYASSGPLPGASPNSAASRYSPGRLLSIEKHPTFGMPLTKYIYLIKPALVERLRALAATAMAMMSQKAPIEPKVRFIGRPRKTGKSAAISEMSATVRNNPIATVSRFMTLIPFFNWKAWRPDL